MQYSSNARIPSAAFSLLEMSIVILILGIMVASIMPAITQKELKEKQAELAQKMDAIEAALQAFRVKNNRLPCPAQPTLNDANANFGVEAATPGTCTGGTPAATSPATNVVVGAIPMRSLGLEDSMGFDPWGRAFTYMVDAEMTGESSFTIYPLDSSVPGNITVQQRDVTASSLSDSTTKAVAVVLSHGVNGHGGYMRSGSRYSSGSTNTDELENCNCNSASPPATGTDNASFIMTLNSSSDSSSVTGFDDTLRYYKRASFIAEGELLGVGSVSNNEFPDTYITFDGSDDYIDASALNSGTVYSFSFWLNLSSNVTSVTGPNTVFAVSGNYHGVGLGAITGSLTGETLTILEAGSPRTGLNATITAGLHHVAGAFDGSNWTIYLDGAAQTVIEAGTHAAMTIDSTGLFVGTRQDQSIDIDNHDMYDFRLYSDELTSSEVTYLYNKGASGTNPGTSNLLVHYKFDDGAGTVVVDSSGNRYDGTATNVTESTFWNPYTP